MFIARAQFANVAEKIARTPVDIAAARRSERGGRLKSKTAWRAELLRRRAWREAGGAHCMDGFARRNPVKHGVRVHGEGGKNSWFIPVSARNENWELEAGRLAGPME